MKVVQRQCHTSSNRSPFQRHLGKLYNISHNVITCKNVIFCTQYIKAYSLMHEGCELLLSPSYIICQ